MQALIINHYPPVIGRIKEIQQVAKAEDIEFSKLIRSMHEVARNMFVLTADESGIQRLEKMLGIIHQEVQGLEERRIYILAMMNRRKMGLSEIEKMLETYSKGIQLVPDYTGEELEVIIGPQEGNPGLIYEILDNIIPVNMCMEMIHERVTDALPIYCGEVMEQADIMELKQR